MTSALRWTCLGGSKFFSAVVFEGQMGTKLGGPFPGGMERNSSYYSFWKGIAKCWVYRACRVKTKPSLTGVPDSEKESGRVQSWHRCTPRIKDSVLIISACGSWTRKRGPGILTEPLPSLSQRYYFIGKKSVYVFFLMENRFFLLPLCQGRYR